MTRTDESPGGLVRRERMSSADARFPSAKTAFMISRSRRVSRSWIVLDLAIVSYRSICDACRILHATGVACQVPANWQCLHHGVSANGPPGGRLRKSAAEIAPQQALESAGRPFPPPAAGKLQKFETRPDWGARQNRPFDSAFCGRPRFTLRTCSIARGSTQPGCRPSECYSEIDFESPNASQLPAGNRLSGPGCRQVREAHLRLIPPGGQSQDWGELGMAAPRRRCNALCPVRR